MSIKGLIKGETIKIDNHSAGQAIDIDDRGLHLHKRFNKACKKHGKAEAIIPLNEGNITFRNVDNKEGKEIVNEISRTLKDSDVRNRFVGQLVDCLNDLAKYKDMYIDKNQNYDKDNRKLNDEGYHKLKNIINHVADIFDVKSNDLVDFEKIGEKAIAKYKSQYLSTKGIMHLDAERTNLCTSNMYVKADLQECSFTVTRSRKMLDEPWVNE